MDKTEDNSFSVSFIDAVQTERARQLLIKNL